MSGYSFPTWMFPWVQTVFLCASAWLSYQQHQAIVLKQNSEGMKLYCYYPNLLLLCAASFAWSLTSCFESIMLPQISKTWSCWICYYWWILDEMLLSKNENINNFLNHGKVPFPCRYCFENRSLYEQHQSRSSLKWITYSPTGSHYWRLMLINTTFNIRRDFWKQTNLLDSQTYVFCSQPLITDSADSAGHSSHMLI